MQFNVLQPIRNARNDPSLKHIKLKPFKRKDLNFFPKESYSINAYLSIIQKKTQNLILCTNIIFIYVNYLYSA